MKGGLPMRSFLGVLVVLAIASVVSLGAQGRTRAKEEVLQAQAQRFKGHAGP